MLYEKVCGYKPCSKLFTATHYLTKYCSEECRDMDHEYICAYAPCGKRFRSRQHHPKFCSISCGGLARALQDADGIRAYLLANIQMPSEADGCWIWTGNIHKHGYGQATTNRKQEGAHRVAYEHFIGPITDNLHVLHGPRCKTRACVNPLHMHLGTEVDNVRDRVEFGNNLVGSKAPSATMTEAQALHVLQDYHDRGISDVEIAKRRKRHINTIRSILRRESWAHVAPGKYPAIGDRRTRLNPTIVRELRHLYEVEHWDYPAMLAHINAKYPKARVTYVMAWGICNYKAWKHVLPTPEPSPHECANTGPYCNCCGECLVCFATEPCYASEDRVHVHPAS